jgi:hypothetical protein
MAVAQMILVAATPSPPTDLSTLLGPPPSTDWVDVASAPNTLVGSFSAHDYAVFLNSVGTSPGSVETELNLYGFTRGYGLEWEQRGTTDVLVERVFEFRDSAGANYWYSALKRGSEVAPEYTKAIPTSTIPHSFGAVLHGSGSYQYRVEFAKGNLMFVVHMDSDTHDLSEPAIAQAASMYQSAPDHSQVPPGAGQAVNDLVRNIEIAAGALIVALAIIVAVVLLLATRRRRPAALPALGISMSPDGAYWWDGVQWRDASRETPAHAQLSPDGAYWWDGRTWRPIAARSEIGN